MLNFARKKEWSPRSEKFFAKARRSGIKDILLGKLTISRPMMKYMRKQTKETH
jgi:hypothetical protein